MFKYNIEVEQLQGGAQPRAYAAHEYEYIIKFTMHNPYLSDGIEWRPYEYNEHLIEDCIKSLPFVKSWKNKDEEHDWADAYLESIDKLSEGLYHVLVKEPYTD